MQKGHLFVRNLSSKGLTLTDAPNFSMFSIAFNDIDHGDKKSFIFGKVLDGFEFLEGLD